MTKAEAIQIIQGMELNEFDNPSLCEEAISMAVQALKNSGGWISVRDRLPEKEGSTLICTEKGAVCTARFYPQSGRWNGWSGKNSRYWMPLPEPPKEE